MTDTLDNIDALFRAAKRFDRIPYSGRVRLLAKVATLSCQVRGDEPLHLAMLRLKHHLQQRQEPHERRRAPGRLWYQYDTKSGKWEEWEHRHFWEGWQRIRRAAEAAGEWETVVSLDNLRDAIHRHEGSRAESEEAAQKARIMALAESLNLTI